MKWIQRQWQKLRHHRQRTKAPVASKESIVAKHAAIKKTVQVPPPAGNLQKARQQALQVDKELFKKGITIPKGKDVKKIDPPTPTPRTGWKPTNLPPGRGHQKGKSMRP